MGLRKYSMLISDLRQTYSPYIPGVYNLVTSYPNVGALARRAPRWEIKKALQAAPFRKVIRQA